MDSRAVFDLHQNIDSVRTVVIRHREADMTATIRSAVRDQAAGWLELVDRSDARGSWEAAGATFRSAVSPESWAKELGAARGPLGPLTSRALAVEQFLNGLPGSPPGEYVVQQYHSVYDTTQAVTETVTLVSEADGRWRVVGYFIR
jgi:hypothetical protein